MIITSRNVGRCLTENKRDDYDSLVPTFTKFICFSQFIQSPSNVNVLDNRWVPSIMTSPRCNIGDKLYGIKDDGDLVFLMSIIDSSD